MNPKVDGKKRCRMHGAFAGAPKGNKNAMKHGRFSTEAVAHRRLVRAVLLQTRRLLASG